MSRERSHRGDRDGRSRQFDWYALAREHGLSYREAHALWQDVARQTSQRQWQAEAVYRQLLESRPSRTRIAPGKHTRTEHSYGAPCLWRASTPGVAAGKRTRTMTLAEEAEKRRRADVQPADERFPGYAEVVAIMGGASSQPSQARAPEVGRQGVSSIAFDAGLHAMLEGHVSVSEPEPLPAFRDPQPEVSAQPQWEQSQRIAARTERRSRPHPDRMQAPKAPAMVPEGSGQPLPESVRAPFEAAMGRSLAGVRIHTDDAAAKAAAALGANAFTVESDIYFGAGQYAPGTPHGDRVLAHELVHVGQRQDGRMASGGGVAAHDDPLENEAYGAEQEIAQKAQETRSDAAESVGSRPAESGEGVSATGSSPIHRDGAEEGEGTGPTVPEQSDAQIFGQADEVVNEEIPVEEAEEGGAEGAEGAEGGEGAEGASAEAQGGGNAPAGPAVEAAGGPGPVAVAPTVLAPIQVEIPAAQSAGVAPSAAPAAPADQAAGMGDLTGTVASAGAALHAEVAAAAAGVEGAITAHAAALSAQVQASIDSARSAIDGAFDAQIQAVSAAASEVQAQMEAAIADCIAQIEAGHAAQVAAAEADRGARHADADAQVEATRQRMNAMGLREAARARDGSAQRAEQAMALAQVSGGGDAACADAQRQAAERIAAKTAEEIRAKGESLAEGATQAAADASAQLDGSADKYHSEIDSSYDGVVEQLGQVREATVAAVQEQSAGPTEQVASVESAAVEQLEGQRQAAHADLDALATHVMSTIDAGAAGLVESLGAQVDELLAGVDAEVAAASASLATVADPEAAQALSAEITASMQQASAEIGATLSQVQTVSIAELDGLLKQSDATVANLVEGAVAAADGAGQEAVSRLNQAAGAAVDGLAEVATRGNAQLEGLLAEAQAKLDEAKQGLTDDLNTQATAVEDEVTGLVDEGLSEEDQQLAQSESTIQEAMGEIAGQYDSLKSETEGSANRRVHRGFWSDLANAVSDAASAIANWFMNSFLPWLGGAILGFLVTAIFLIVAAVVVAALIAAGPWGWAVLAVLAIGMVAMLINRRYNEWVEDLGEPGFWGWCGIVGLAILDITGIVLIFEGLFCKRITGGELDPFDGGWRFGEGLALLLGTALAVRAWFKGRGAGAEGGGREGGSGEGGGREGGGREGGGEGREGGGEGREGGGEGREGGEGEGREGGEGEGREGGEGEGGGDGYDPSTRTRQELEADRNPDPRPGETPEQAAERARLAEEEILRRSVEIYDQLGEEPREVNVQAEESLHADAHTMERHGPDIPLRRGDNPGGRTIEGRIFGDTPWGGQSNASARWLSHSKLHQVVNNYIRGNWEAIRSDLALNGRHSNSFDAGSAVGEGFVNGGSFGQGPRTAVYARTSLVRITIVLDAGSPPSFHIITTFPNLMGAPAH